MSIRMSKTSKMGCRSWSLEAGETCPGSFDPLTKELVPACAGCYALGGFYNMKSVKEPRQENREDWKRADWVQDMIAELDNDRYFRWFDSGDMYHHGLAVKILEVMQHTPWCKHWLPTRMHKFSKFLGVIEQMQALPNVVVRLSSDSITGETIEGETTSTIVPTSDDVREGQQLCPAYTNKGKCGKCRACWDKGVQVIAYPAHGAKMLKNIKIIVENAE